MPIKVAAKAIKRKPVVRRNTTPKAPPAPMFYELKEKQLERIKQAIELAAHRWGCAPLGIDEDGKPLKPLLPRPYTKEETAKMKMQDGKCFRIVSWGNPDADHTTVGGWVLGRWATQESLDEETTETMTEEERVDWYEKQREKPRRIAKSWLGMVDPDEADDITNFPDTAKIYLQIGTKKWDVLEDADGNTVSELEINGWQVHSELLNFMDFIKEMTEDSEDGKDFLEKSIQPLLDNPTYQYEGYDWEEGYIIKREIDGEGYIDAMGNVPVKGARKKCQDSQEHQFPEKGVKLILKKSN